MSVPVVSVVCTNYNKGDWIKDAIESFLSQKTNFDYEIILIDDKSTDHSKDIIKEYAKKYPKKIRAFYNKKNLGITKTWIKVCKEAKGKYIARCDGDDYWIDDNKLQMQVDALNKSKESDWCTTDYNIISPEGKTLKKSAVENGIINRPDSYAEMLVSKGMTMASTWLVDTKLMQEINKDLDVNAVDDTFNIQLDLFNKTKLTYLPEATVVYRINEGSDSRPEDFDSISRREDNLLKTQLQYIDKYKNVDYRDIIILALKECSTSINRLYLIKILQEDQENKNRYIKIKEKEIAEKDKYINDLLNSRNYRLGSFLTSPAVKLKRFFGRLIK